MSEIIEQAVTGAVGVRELSHETTAVLKSIEAERRLVAVTRHGQIVGLLIPLNVPSLLRRWLTLNPQRAKFIRSAISADAAAPGSPPDETSGFGENAEPGIVSVGVREFAQSTSEYLRRAEGGDWVLVRRHGRFIALLIAFSLSDLLEIAASQVHDE